ncbi:MAG TPA: nucleotidyl transferase AbiEii/AbiGii toxin family protein [Phycisphaeraceae bacterium]
MSESTSPNLHHDSALFREAVNFTSARTGFSARLVEKDYFCTVLLMHLARHGGRELIFKGGTCLAKVHAGFYRLSEDLDFTIPLPVNASRKIRQQAVIDIKTAVLTVADHLQGFTTADPLQGANDCTQYNGAIRYNSPTTGQHETILVEVSVREPLVMPTEAAPLRTLLLDPISDQPSVRPLTINSIAMMEAMAEKFRAALSRRDVAIRDFYDLDHAVERLGFAVDDRKLIAMIRQKLAVPGNLAVDVSSERFASLKRQLDARLRMVLRDVEFQAFDLERAIRLVVAMAERLA